MKNNTNFLFTIVPLLILMPFVFSGCGFKLRGVESLPSFLNTIELLPFQPYDPFQKLLRQTLKSNQVKVLNGHEVIAEADFAKLTILEQNFSEETTGYGADGQVNYATFQLTITYQIVAKHGEINIDPQTVQVQRELVIEPTQVLQTDNERVRLKGDLYSEAASQLLRQLSVLR